VTIVEFRTSLLAGLGLLFILGLVAAAEPDHRFVRKYSFPMSQAVIVVAEGDFEPRSVGSYTLRVYGGKSQEFPIDDFVTGIVRPRRGTVEDLTFADFDGDGRPEIVVIMRSAGTGGYLSADAFRYRKSSLKLVVSVTDLDKSADPIQAVRERLKKTR
jgi:hypothetical protein